VVIFSGEVVRQEEKVQGLVLGMEDVVGWFWISARTGGGTQDRQATLACGAPQGGGKTRGTMRGSSLRGLRSE
jgi:hypothetical protein